MIKGQRFHVASSKGCHYSGLTFVNGVPWNRTVQPRGPLKGTVSYEFWIEIKESRGGVLVIMFKNISGQFYATHCAKGPYHPKNPGVGSGLVNK